MPKVYVVAALMPMGGAYMAYHIGRLLHLHYGYEFINVNTAETAPPSLFTYDIPMETVSTQIMENSLNDDDILIANPSYSHVMMGLRFKGGAKLMYVQDFKTFQVLDCHFDRYVCVSSLVARYLKAIYNMDAPVIPAFIPTDALPSATPWRERPEGSIYVYTKHANHEHRAVRDYLIAALRERGIDMAQPMAGAKLSHAQFMEKLGSVRTLVHLSLAEGFGLVPLEAMAMGTMVTGLDGLGGADYMRSGENCLVGSVNDIRKLPDIIHRAVTDTALAERCAAAGKITAANYSYDAFKTAWLAEFAAWLG